MTHLNPCITLSICSSSGDAGLVIGTGGKNIGEVERLTNTIISVYRGSGLLGGGNKKVMVLGSEENCKKALLIILGDELMNTLQNGLVGHLSSRPKLHN